MLILARRPRETLVFPTLGITIEVAHVQGKLVKLGVDAPREIPVLRGELAPHASVSPELTTLPVIRDHAARNRWHRAQLAMHLAQRQLEAGQTEAASQTLALAVDHLEAMDPQCRLEGSRMPAAERRALVVDDDLNEGSLLAGILRMNGFAVTTAGDGCEALERLESESCPDLVLLDMLMPRCDGPTTIRAIRANPALNGLRVFALSGVSPDTLGVPRGPTGCDRWFPKPVRPEVLMRELDLELSLGSSHAHTAC